MGLAVSQVRLLALTRRKADIELNIQIDSKRKQALTRKSTELSQTYYQKLQQAKIQYATSDGYENVNYDYIMGKSNGAAYDDEFLKQVMFMNGNIDQKTCNSMILTNKHGEVVVNDEIASIVTLVKSTYNDKNITTDKQTAEAIRYFIEQNSNVDSNLKGEVTGFGKIAEILKKLDKEKLKNSSMPSSIEIIQKILKNGGYMEGGVLYADETSNSGLYFPSAEMAKNASKRTSSDAVRLQDGYNYTILNADGSIHDQSNYTCMYSSSVDDLVPGTAKAEMQYLGNIVSYFGPILAAALKNGITSDVEISGVKHPTTGVALNKVGPIDLGSSTTPNDPLAAATNALNSAPDNSYVIVKDTDGTKMVWQKVNNVISKVRDLNQIQIGEIKHDEYILARDTNVLQNGFQSGMFQLCMVDNMAKGRYHKNTTLDFFIQMSYVSEKMDSSAREEITAWYNSEQAKISEQETYWDEEITNLSTELNSVNTEVDSVKTLKSNAIKSVFDWGSS